MLEAKDMSPREGIYTFIDNEGNNVNIASERLYQWCCAARPEMVLVPVEPRIARKFQEDNVIDMTRVIELACRKYLDPIIFAKCETSTNGGPDVMLVDGHHRYALAAAMRLSVIPAYVLEPAQWHPFRVKDLIPITQDQLRDIPITKRSY